MVGACSRLPASIPAADDPATPARVALGRMLYYDTRLSLDCTVSCNSCVFKVPSLHNIERTAPYFHDGQVATLDEAVRWMARHQLGRDLSAAEAGSLVTWLKSLTGAIPQDYIAPPRLPPR